MKTKTLVKIGKKSVLEVKISIENNYFSVTASKYEKLERGYKYHDYKEFNNSKFEFTEGGCIHDTVLKAFPNLKPIIDLHLSDLKGEPMHMVANGLYHFEQNKETAKEYLRITDSDFEGVKDKKDLILLFPKLIEQYEEEAKQALILFNTL